MRLAHAHAGSYELEIGRQPSRQQTLLDQVRALTLFMNEVQVDPAEGNLELWRREGLRA